jgi:hypothetical protein
VAWVSCPCPYTPPPPPRVTLSDLAALQCWLIGCNGAMGMKCGLAYACALCVGSAAVGENFTGLEYFVICLLSLFTAVVVGSGRQPLLCSPNPNPTGWLHLLNVASISTSPSRWQCKEWHKAVLCSSVVAVLRHLTPYFYNCGRKGMHSSAAFGAQIQLSPHQRLHSGHGILYGL